MGKEIGLLIAVQTRDRDGCRDESEDRDDDNDGVPDDIDEFPYDNSSGRRHRRRWNK